MAQPGVENASPARSSWKAPPNSNSNSPTPDSRPSSSSAPVRPVTARTWQALNSGSSSPTSNSGEAPKRVSVYTNDLYSPPSDDRPRSPSARPVTPRSAERLQQQLVKSSPGRASSPLPANPSRLQMSTTNVPVLALPRPSSIAYQDPASDSLDSLLARAAKAVAEETQQAQQQEAPADSAGPEALAAPSAQADDPSPAAPAQLQRPTTAPVRSATINIAALAGARAGGAASPSNTLGAVRGAPRTMQTAVFQNFAGSSPASPRMSIAGGPSAAGRSPLSGARPSTPSFQPVATPRPGTAMADFNIKSSKYPGQGAAEAAGEGEGTTAGFSSHALPRRPYPAPPSTAPAKADIKAGAVVKKDKLAGFGIISGAFVAVRGGGSGGRRGSAEGVEEALDKAALKAMQHADMLAEAELSSKAGLRKFLLMPGPTDKPLRCKIFRTKSGLMKSHSQYVLMLEDSEIFLLAGRKRKSGAQGSEYTISVDKHDLAHRGPNFFGKLRSNFIGTEFVCYDDAEKHKGGDNYVNARGELAAVSYQTNVLGTKGPRKMTVLVPKLDPVTGSPLKLVPRGANDSMLARYKAYDLKDTVVLRNKPPKWNEALGAYCLNFGGRVSQASVKNFQLVSVDNMERIILQFGKVGSDTFTMDYAYPMTAMQAFAICLSSFDSKLACE